MNRIQEAIFVGSREESGIWEVLNDIADSLGVDREMAFSLVRGEVGFLAAREDIFLIKSKRLYESDGCVVLDPRTLADLTLNDVEFREEGPFYYFSNVPMI
jgi:hypothetical protein